MSDAYERFKKSMNIGYDEWREGTGYDLQALAELTSDERHSVEIMLKGRGPGDWRAVQALASMKSASAMTTVREQLDADNPEVRLTAIRELFDAGEIKDLSPHIDRLLEEHSDHGPAYSQALDMIWWHNLKSLTPRLLALALDAEGYKASHAAATLLYLHGLAESPFDWSQRPFFLRFNTTDITARRAAYRELCEKIGVKG